MSDEGSTAASSIGSELEDGSATAATKQQMTEMTTGIWNAATTEASSSLGDQNTNISIYRLPLQLTKHWPCVLPKWQIIQRMI